MHMRFSSVPAGNERGKMDNSSDRKKLWAQAVEVSFSWAKTKVRCKLWGIYYDNTE